MADIRKTITGLECLWHCISPVGHSCGDCPQKYNRVECKRRVINDALTMLKAQEPKVMTLEEVVKTERNTPIYIDQRYGMHGWDIYDGVDIQAKDIVTGAPWASNEFWGWDEYGKTWRCWTSRPTDEQRKAVKWDD